MNPATRSGVLLALALLPFAACRPAAPPDVPPDEGPPPTNRIAVPELVRRNLGIAFAAVERRRIAQTLRVPGHFELLPAARHEHRVPVSGRVAVLVQPLQTVTEGDLLYRLDSPEWRRVQRELGELATAVRVTEARLLSMQPVAAAHREHEQSLMEAIAVMAARVASLEETRASVGGQAQELAAARVQLAQVRAELAEVAEKHAETDALLAELQANLAAGRDRFQLAIEAAATLASVTPDAMQAATGGEAGGAPAWRKITSIEVRAAAAGVVDKLPVATGVWVETGALVLTVTDVTQVRFRARGLQSDLPLLRAGLPARIVPPHGGAAPGDALPGVLMLGIEADPAQRTIDLFVQPSAGAAWARPGVAAFLEVETEGTAAPELAVPLSAVLLDGMQKVLFRRDPADPDQVIRIEADLGLDDGRWVEVKSGLRDGDAVVLAGAYELMLASSATAGKGGHFHADGTFHADEHK